MLIFILCALIFVGACFAAAEALFLATWVGALVLGLAFGFRHFRPFDIERGWYHRRALVVSLAGTALILSASLLTGCYDMHGRYTPVIPMGDSGPFVGGDAGSVTFVTDAGMPESDSAVIVADAGSDAGSPAPLANIVVNLAWEGRLITEADLPITVDAVKKQRDIVSVGIAFRAPDDSGVTFSEIRLAGRADVTGAWREGDLNEIVTSCSLFDGDTRVGRAHSPYDSGVITILGLSYRLEAGEERILEARCSVDSVVAQETGDRFAIGLPLFDVDPFVAVDDAGNSRLPQFGRTLLNQLDPLMQPGITVLVHDRGELTVVPCDHPEWDIVVAGGDTYHFLAQYCVSARYEDVMIERGRIASHGEAASFQRVAMAVDGVIHGSSILPWGRDRSVDIDMSADPIFVPRDGMVRIQLWALLSDVVSSASVGGATAGVARSGEIIQLGLSAGLIDDGWWDPSFAGHFNLLTRGATSGDRPLAEGVTNLGGYFVVRRTRPSVVIVPPEDGLVIGDNTLGTVQVGADPAGAIGLRRFTIVLFGSSFGLTDRFTLSNFRLVRNGRPVPSENVVIVDDQGNDLESSPWTAGPMLYQTVSVDLIHEDVITGSGGTYSVHADGSGRLLSGDFISVQVHDGKHPFSTGYVYESSLRIEDPGTVSGETMVGPFLDASLPSEVSGSGLMWAEFLWSDLVEVPHSDAVRELGGSRDWMDGGMVLDLSSSITTIYTP